MLTMMWVALLTLVPLVSLALSNPELAAFSKTNGVYTATVGAKCVTLEDGVSAFYISDLEAVQAIFRAGDNAAFHKFLETKRAFITKPGVEVFVEARHESNVKVRPQGEVGTVWIAAYSLECPSAVAKNKKGK